MGLVPLLLQFSAPGATLPSLCVFPTPFPHLSRRFGTAALPSTLLLPSRPSTSASPSPACAIPVSAVLALEMLLEQFCPRAHKLNYAIGQASGAGEAWWPGRDGRSRVRVQSRLLEWTADEGSRADGGGNMCKRPYGRERVMPQDRDMGRQMQNRDFVEAQREKEGPKRIAQYTTLHAAPWRDCYLGRKLVKETTHLFDASLWCSCVPRGAAGTAPIICVAVGDQKSWAALAIPALPRPALRSSPLCVLVRIRPPSCCSEEMHERPRRSQITPSAVCPPICLTTTPTTPFTLSGKIQKRKTWIPELNIPCTITHATRRRALVSTGLGAARNVGHFSRQSPCELRQDTCASLPTPLVQANGSDVPVPAPNPHRHSTCKRNARSTAVPEWRCSK